jgi:hypothetical protein
MPLARRASKKMRSFDLPVSYKIGETRERLRDALNVYSNQGRLETRFGRSRYNPTGLGGSVKSLSFFKHANGTRYLIAKIGTTLVSVSNSGAHTTIKTGLSADTKHRGITWARGVSSRHIIAVEGDGLFQWDGTNFTQLGQDPPTAPTLATATGTLPDGTYKVYITYYSSTTGFESNASLPTAGITTSSQGLGISSIPATAANATIDKVRIYLKNTASADDPVYAGEVSLGTTTYEISESPVSTETYPLSNAKPLSGGGKYFTEFNRKLVYAGNGTYKNDVFFSEIDLPDAFNDGTGPDRLVLNPIYDGHITGIATGLYNNTVLNPYLVIFKERSTHIYSEINGEGNLIPISQEIGCVSHDTIRVKNGNVFFLSTSGWRAIENGRLVLGGNSNNSKDNPITLGLGDVDDIFTSPGYIYEANKSRLSDAFSVYYSTLDQYFTWIAEGAENDFTKAYVYEFKLGGFKPYSFHSPATSACVGEDTNGKEVVFMGDDNGYVYTHSINEERSDDDENGDDQNIYAFAQMTWQDGDDFDASFNFRELIIRRVAGNASMDVKAWINFSLDEIGDTFVYENPREGFVLDVSELDSGSFGSDDRTILTARADINRTGENILLGFYQNSQGVSLGLVAAQLDYSRNGNRNAS